MHPYPSNAVGVRNTTPSLPKFLRSLERSIHTGRATLNLGKRRAERRREARADAHFRKCAGSAKAADRQFALHPEA